MTVWHRDSSLKNSSASLSFLDRMQATREWSRYSNLLSACLFQLKSTGCEVPRGRNYHQHNATDRLGRPVSWTHIKPRSLTINTFKMGIEHVFLVWDYAWSVSGKLTLIVLFKKKKCNLSQQMLKCKAFWIAEIRDNLNRMVNLTFPRFRLTPSTVVGSPGKMKSIA